MRKAIVGLMICPLAIALSSAAQDLNVSGSIHATGGIAANGYTPNGSDVSAWSAEFHGALSVGGGNAPNVGDIGASGNLFVAGRIGVGTTTPNNVLTLGPSASPTWNGNYKVIDLAGYGAIMGSSNGTGWPGTGYGQSGWNNNSYFTGYQNVAIGDGAASYILQGTGQIEFGVAPPVSAGSAQAFAAAMRITNSGAVGIGTSAPAYRLDVAGQVRTTGGVVFPDGTTQTTAFSPTICGGDYAESVDVSGDRTSYEPGDVIVIDPAAPGKFLKSAVPYSTSVTGIYSTKPGTVGRRQITPKNADELPMAMIGIVPTKVSDENGPINSGDLLVTASKVGYAMKGTDRSRMLGAVIGKALGTLRSGTGVIEVVVTLQ